MPPVIIKQGDRSFSIDESQVPEALSQGFHVEGADEHAGRISHDFKEDVYGGAAGKTVAGLAGAARGLTLGASDVLGNALGGRDLLSNLQEANPTISTVGNVVGSIAPAVLTGGASLVEQGVATGAKVVAKRSISSAVAHGAAEGAIQGAGQGVSELALSDDPLTMERAVSVLSSNALLGGVIGGAVGGLGRAAEKGLTSVNGAIDEHLATAAARDAVPEDLAAMDARGLRAAKDTELESLKATRATDTQQLVEDLGVHREAGLGERTWRATEGAETGELREIGAMSKKADDRIRNILNNPKAVVENPRPVLSALTQQEHAMESLLEAAPKVKAEVASSNIGKSLEEVAGPNARLAALDKVPAALERNRTLQEQLKAIISEPKSARLDAIAAAGDALSNAPPQGMVEKAGRGALFGAAVGAVGSIPILGQIPGAAHLLGAKLADSIGNKVFGRLGAGASEVAKRTSAAVGKFLDVAPKIGAPIARAAPVLATRVLSQVRYAPPKQDRSEPEAAPGHPQLAEAYRARASEIRSQVAHDPQTGQLAMRPEARAAIAVRLRPIAAAAPKIADQLETNAVRRLEFLASKLPIRPDLPIPPGGKDIWQPSSLAMRTFARFAAAVEDPGAVEERLAHGTVTPEDAEAYQTVYPERFAHMQQTIIERLPELRSTLPYKRRLALSIFTGAPVDPAMTPAILNVLQQSFENDNTAAANESPPGMSAPKAMPQFGSVKAEPPTPSQERAS